MSHFTTIKIQITDREVLLASLSDLGYKVEQNTQVRGYQGIHTTAELVIRQANGYDLGFRQREDGYELVADLWGAGINHKTFLDQITQKYAHRKLLKTAEVEGFQIEAEEVLEDGTVRVVVGRWR